MKDIQLGTYKGLEITAPDLTVTEKELNNALANLQKENAILIHVDDRAAQNGDRAVLDFQGYFEDKPLAGTKAKRFPMILGSHRFIPEFEDQIIGKMPGDAFDIFATFPENYPDRKTAGKNARFSVTLLSLGIQELPALDDDFALDFSEFETMEDLKASLKETLTEKKEEKENARIQDELLGKIIETSEFSLNDDIVAEIEDELLEEFEDDIHAHGMSMDQFFQRTGQTTETLQQKYHKKAYRQVAETTVLHAIAQKEHLTFSDEELEDAVYDMAEYYETDPLEFLQELDPQELNGLKLELLCQKAMEFVLEHAVLL